MIIPEMFYTPIFLHDDFDEASTLYESVHISRSNAVSLTTSFYLLFCYALVFFFLYQLDKRYHFLPPILPRRRTTQRLVQPLKTKKPLAKLQLYPAKKVEREKPKDKKKASKVLPFEEDSLSEADAWCERHESRLRKNIGSDYTERKLFVLEHHIDGHSSFLWSQARMSLAPMVTGSYPIPEQKRERKVRFNDHVEKFEYESELPDRLRKARQPVIIMICQMLQSREIQRKKLLMRLFQKLRTMRRRKKVGLRRLV